MAPSHLPSQPHLPSQASPPSPSPLTVLWANPRNRIFLAIALVVCGAFAMLALQSGISTATFEVLAAGDFLTGSPFFSHIPAIMWALWGLVFGAVFGFWLEAPLYGWRQSRIILLCIPLLLMLITALWANSSQAQAPSLQPPVAPPPPPTIPPNFGGTWNTNWGEMKLQQDGDQVSGTYTYSNGTIQGSVRRASDGSLVLNYYWINHNGSGSGIGFFVLSANTNAIQGDYNQSQDFSTLNPTSTSWSGTRTGSPPPPPTFSGDWNTSWGPMHLSQGVTQVNGTYEYGGGLIEGTLAPGGKTLDFKWTNRVTGETGIGKFNLIAFGKSFTGSWSEGSTLSPSAEAWTGQKTEGNP